MVMVDSCARMAKIHDRMPVILKRDQWGAVDRGNGGQGLQPGPDMARSARDRPDGSEVGRSGPAAAVVERLTGQNIER